MAGKFNPPESGKVPKKRNRSAKAEQTSANEAQSQEKCNTKRRKKRT
jgi:hypothetical protein